jgi:hypothetical protein
MRREALQIWLPGEIKREARDIMTFCRAPLRLRRGGVMAGLWRAARILVIFPERTPTDEEKAGSFVYVVMNIKSLRQVSFAEGLVNQRTGRNIWMDEIDKLIDWSAGCWMNL